jgi:hypothetical protein
MGKKKMMFYGIIELFWKNDIEPEVRFNAGVSFFGIALIFP